MNQILFIEPDTEEQTLCMHCESVEVPDNVMYCFACDWKAD
jgi:hypothetical protein